MNNSRYKYAENSNKLCLNPDTRVYNCEDFKGPPFGFCFVSFSNIQTEDSESDTPTIGNCYSIILLYPYFRSDIMYT